MAPGEVLATMDPDTAQELIQRRVKELEAARRNRTILGIERNTYLAEFAAYHLTEKKQTGGQTDEWLAAAQKHLEEAVAFLGEQREIGSITTRDVQRYLVHLKKLPGRMKDSKIGTGTQRAYLNSLSNLYRRAISEGRVPPGFNPVAALMDKPTAKRKEARWLEVPDAALLLESSRTLKTSPELGYYPFAFPLLATYLLTGGRKREVLGLEVDDISFDRDTVRFMPNDWRRIKSEAGHRVIRLMPQLREILQEYVFGGSAPRGRLLFPSVRGDGEKMLDNFDGTLSAIAKRAGFKASDIHLHALRHTYCAARLQTLDNGHPISEFTVGRELGHGGTQLVKRIYGHLGNVRHRSEWVEYRIEQHRDALAGRLVF